VEANVIISLSKYLTAVAATWLMIVPAQAQEGKWAAPSDATAQQIISWERQWAEEACTYKGIPQTILADDFQGTSTDGKRYSKAEELESNKPSKVQARNCRLNDARVRCFGDNIALVYGAESSIRKSRDGKDYRKCQVWTDTWLKRNGKWTIVAAQDTQTDCKQSPFHD
jgi:hypothetical protein